MSKTVPSQKIDPPEVPSASYSQGAFLAFLAAVLDTLGETSITISRDQIAGLSSRYIGFQRIDHYDQRTIEFRLTRRETDPTLPLEDLQKDD